MLEDYNGYREPKKKKAHPFVVAATYMVALVAVIGVAVAGVYVANFAEKVSIDYRTDASTEVHKVEGNPYVHLGDKKPVKRVKIGTLMYIHNNYIKTEMCSVQVSTVFWDYDTHVVHHYSAFVNWFKPGTFEADEMYPIPEYMPPGNYHVVKKSISMCNGKEHYSVNFDVLVELYK
ncbi:MAG: hypothetical protein EOP84_37215 [Verrucomicrobiaceae bacterium]|nr:MAG: hypothetical protein EOP84_37215 [Verrucomicrobiaceae bacterium]